MLLDVHRMLRWGRADEALVELEKTLWFADWPGECKRWLTLPTLEMANELRHLLTVGASHNNDNLLLGCVQHFADRLGSFEPDAPLTEAEELIHPFCIEYNSALTVLTDEDKEVLVGAIDHWLWFEATDEHKKPFEIPE